MAKPSPEFDGRLSLDLGPLSLRIPYKMEATKMETRIGKYGIALPVSDYQKHIAQLEGNGLTVAIGQNLIDPALLFLSGLKGDEFEGNLKIYTDAVIPRPEPVETKIVLEEYMIGGVSPSSKDDL